MFGLKLSSLFSFHLKSDASKPNQNLGDLLSTLIIEPPENAISDDAIPYLELRRILFIHRDRHNKCPIRGQWQTALVEKHSDEVIPFSEIKGCMSSKSDATDFELMRYNPKASANVGFHISAYYDRVEELADQVLNGTFDCAIYKGKPAKIVRQEWDSNMWLANDGGSHRSCAVWHIDKEQGNTRSLTAHVTTTSISPEFRNICHDHSIWLFKIQSHPDIHELISSLRQNEARLSTQSDGFLAGVAKDYCLIIRKDAPSYAKIAQVMGSAFDLSGWVNSIYSPYPALDKSVRLETAFAP